MRGKEERQWQLVPVTDLEEQDATEMGVDDGIDLGWSLNLKDASHRPVFHSSSAGA